MTMKQFINRKKKLNSRYKYISYDYDYETYRLIVDIFETANDHLRFTANT